MAIIYVPRSDTLEEFRQKFNQLSELIGDVSLLSSDSPVASVVEAIDLLVLPFYDSTGAVKDIPLKIA